MQAFCQNLKKLFFWNFATLPRWAFYCLVVHLLFMICFALYVDMQICFASPEELNHPDPIFSIFFDLSLLLAYATPLFWIWILILACMKSKSWISRLATFCTVSLLGMLTWYMQVVMVLAYH